MARRITLLSLVVLILSLVGCDHATKAVARAELAQSGPVALVPGVLDLRYVQNEDTAFSLTRDLDARIKAPLLAALSVLGLVGIAALARRRLPGASTGERVALSLVSAGAIANVIDRLRHGYVVDFIHVHAWPVFNVADVLIVVGVAWLFIAYRRAPAV